MGPRRLARRALLRARIARSRLWSRAARWQLQRAVRRDGVVQLWVGDSHARYYTGLRRIRRLQRAGDGVFACHAGARLMRSLALRGFPDRVVALLAGLRGSPAEVVPLFVAGEIDVRCHLVPRHLAGELDLGFVQAWVDRCCDLAAEAGARRAGIVVPPPPGEDVPELAGLPVRGTLAERVEVFALLRGELAAAVRRTSTAVDCRLVDATDLLAGPDGGLRRELTDDGCHTNPAGAALVRGRAAAVLGLETVAERPPRPAAGQ